MKGYISKWERAHNSAKALGYKETDFGYMNVVRQIFAKMVVNWKTIGRNAKGKLVVHK